MVYIWISVPHRREVMVHLITGIRWVRVHLTVILLLRDMLLRREVGVVDKIMLSDMWIIGVVQGYILRLYPLIRMKIGLLLLLLRCLLMLIHKGIKANHSFSIYFLSSHTSWLSIVSKLIFIMLNWLDSLHRLSLAHSLLLLLNYRLWGMGHVKIKIQKTHFWFWFWIFNFGLLSNLSFYCWSLRWLGLDLRRSLIFWNFESAIFVWGQWINCLRILNVTFLHVLFEYIPSDFIESSAHFGFS